MTEGTAHEIFVTLVSIKAYLCIIAWAILTIVIKEWFFKDL